MPKTRRHRKSTSSKNNRKTKRNHPLNKSILFVDNLRELWEEDMSWLSSAIDFIHIPSNTTNAKSDKEWKYAKSLANEGNLYAIAISKRKFLTYPPNHGINNKVVERLKHWAKSIDLDKRPTVLFDWDRTISCVEEGISADVFKDHIGFSSSYMMNGNAVVWTTFPSKEFLDDMFVYLIRSSRISMIKDLFRELKARGVDIRIVTHNLNASRNSPFRRIFLEMIARLFNDDTHQQKQYEVERNGAKIFVYEEYSSKHQVVSAEEADAMLHSTIDYIREDEPFNKSYAVCRMEPPIEQLRDICGNNREDNKTLFIVKPFVLG